MAGLTSLTPIFTKVIDRPGCDKFSNRVPPHLNIMINWIKTYLLKYVFWCLMMDKFNFCCRSFEVCVSLPYGTLFQCGNPLAISSLPWWGNMTRFCIIVLPVLSLCKTFCIPWVICSCLWVPVKSLPRTDEPSPDYYGHLVRCYWHTLTVCPGTWKAPPFLVFACMQWTLCQVKEQSFCMPCVVASFHDPQCTFRVPISLRGNGS